jgi:hypothetical protein
MNNDIKIDNLFKKIFENINNPIIDILKNTKEIKTSEKLDEITRYLYKNFNPIQVKDILTKNNIIYDKQDRNFSAKNYNTFTNLIRDIDNSNIITNYSSVDESIFAPIINEYNNNIFPPTSINTPMYNHVTNPHNQIFFPNFENNLLPSENIYQNKSINIPSFDESNKIITPTSNIVNYNNLASTAIKNLNDNINTNIPTSNNNLDSTAIKNLNDNINTNIPTSNNNLDSTAIKNVSDNINTNIPTSNIFNYDNLASTALKNVSYNNNNNINTNIPIHNNNNHSYNIVNYDNLASAALKNVNNNINNTNIPDGLLVDQNNEKYISSHNYSNNSFEKPGISTPHFSQNTVLPLVENNYNLSMYDSSLPPDANYSIAPEMTGPGETMLNSLLLSNIQKQIDNLKADEIGCNERIEKVKKDYQSTINNYIDILLKDLIKNEVITELESNTMKKKLQYQEIDNTTLIKYLQDKQTFNKKISINDEYNKFMENKFMNSNYIKPPVCVTNFPQKITQFDPYDTMYAVNK